MEEPINLTESVNWREYEDQLMVLCNSKADDFHLLGYPEVTAADVWRCVRQQAKGKLALHQLVETIVTLKVGVLMNFLTVNAYRGIISGDEFDAVKRG